jgi:hypothetical protein
MYRMELRHLRHFAATTEELHDPRAACPARGLEEPKALRWRATFRSRASLGARSSICAGTALDVNGDHVTSPVASHAAAEVSPPIPTASPRPVPLQWLGAHGIVSLAYASNRAQVASTCIPGATAACRNRPGYCVAGIGDAEPTATHGVRRHPEALLWPGQRMRRRCLRTTTRTMSGCLKAWAGVHDFDVMVRNDPT